MRTSFRLTQARFIAAAVAAVVAVPVVGLAVPGAVAQASFANNFFALGPDMSGSTTGTFGPNEVIHFSGIFNYNRSCEERNGNPDLLWPATDVYVVNDQTEPADHTALSQAGGGTPRTLVSFGAVATDEVLDVTAPGGVLGAGTYSVVYDTCQDGRYNPLEDLFIPGAITVEVPAVLPAAAGWIGDMKSAAQHEGQQWAIASRLLEDLTDLADYLSYFECVTSGVGCVGALQTWATNHGLLPASLEDKVKNLAKSETNSYLSLAADPPRADFAQSTAAVTPGGVDSSPLGSGLTASLASIAPALARENGLLQAFLTSIERYQGAQEAGSAADALARAEEAQSLATAIVTSIGDVSSRLDVVPSTIAGSDPTFDSDVSAVYAHRERIRVNGFTADEVRALRNLGMSSSQIAATRTSLLASDNSELFGLNISSVTNTVAGLSSLAATSAAGFAAAAAGFGQAAATIRASSARADAAVPAMSLDVPMTVAAGASVPLAAHVSASSATTVSWDLNSDGVFGDAVGTATSATFGSPGEHVVSALVSGTGLSSYVMHADVAVTDLNHPPVLATPNPASPVVSVTAGDAVSFSVVPTDADGDTVALAWSFDGLAAGAAPSIAHTFTPAEVGTHEVVVVATDGRPGHTVSHAWQVTVAGSDADGDGWASTASADCNDADPSVHPGATEVLMNGKDDDCDPATLDAPPAAAGGAVTGGVVAAWGRFFGTGAVFGPQYVAGIDNAVQVQMNLEDGFALRSDGTVTAFGPFGSSTRGCGSTSCPSGLTDVVGVGGIGKLAGVTRLNFDIQSNRIAALRQDGSIVDWGSGHLGGGLGAFTFSSSPVPVLRADNGQPLTGVAQIDLASFQSWAITNAGDVWVWGRTAGAGCLGSTRNQQADDLAEPAPELGKVAQISEGYANSALIRSVDGSVSICGPIDPNSPQTWLPRPVPGFGPSGAFGKATQVYSSPSSLWVINDRGQLYGWGNSGTLSVFGVSPANTIVPPFIDPSGLNVPVPTLVPLPPGPPPVSISGTETITLVRADGSTLVWGTNTFGSIGVPGAANQRITATPIDVLGYAFNADNSGWSGAAVVLPRTALAPGYTVPQTWIGVAAGPASGALQGPEASTLSVPLRLTGAVTNDTTVSWTFDGTTGQTIIPAGSASGSASVVLPHDGVNGPSMQREFTITAVSNGVRIDVPSVSVTVTDIDAAPTASVVGATVSEGNTSLTDIAVTVSLSSASGFDTAVSLRTIDSTAVAGTDFFGVDEIVHFAVGETSKVLHISGIGNTVPQADRRFLVQIAGLSHVGTAATSATVAIVDDDPVALLATGATVTRGGAATVSIAAPAQPAGESLTVNWSTADGSATAGADYSNSSGVVVLHGPTPVTVSIPTSATAGSTATGASSISFFVDTTAVTPARAVLPSPPAVVDVVGLPTLDTAPPVITGTPDRAPNANGWYSAPVTITWSAIDAVDGPLPAPPSTLVSLEGDGTGAAATSASVCDSSGNCATGSFGPIKLDSTRPTISAAAGGSPNAAGWYRNPVTVSFGCADGLSGVDVCPAPVDLSDGSAQAVSGTASDLAGNLATASLTGINIDTVAPSVTGTVASAPSGGTWYRSNVGVHWTCSDTGSGLAAACPTDSTISGEGLGLTATTNVFDVAGNLTIGTSPGVDIDRTAPVTTATAPAGWGGAVVNVVLTPFDGLSGVARTDWQLDGGAVQTGTAVTISGNGAHTLVFHSVDLAGNVESPVTATVVVDAGSPIIVPTVTPAPNVAGWNSTPVTVSWTCTDPAGVSFCSSPTVLALQGKNQVLTGTATDVYGNSATAQQLVSIDLTAPTATPTLSSSPNAAGWYRSNVDVTWACTDALSGVATCPTTTTFTQAAPGPLTGSATDNAGNTRSVPVAALKIDSTVPTVTITGVTDGANYAPGTAPSVACTATDDLSGLAAPCTVSVAGPASGLGAFIVTATVADVAGNVGTAKVTYQVASGVCAPSPTMHRTHDDDNCGDDHGEPGHHRGIWNGFENEFHGRGSSSVTNERAGTTVRFAFSLLGDDVLAYGPAEQPRWLVPVKLPSGPGVSTTTWSATDSGASFTSDGANWLYSWKPTKAQIGSSWRIGVRLASGEVYTTVVTVTG